MPFVAYFLIKESVWMTVPQTFHSTVAFLVGIQVPIHTLPGLHRLDCNGMFAAMRALVPEFNGRYRVFHAKKVSNRHLPPRSPLAMPSGAIRKVQAPSTLPHAWISLSLFFLMARPALVRSSCPFPYLAWPILGAAN